MEKKKKNETCDQSLSCRPAVLVLDGARRWSKVYYVVIPDFIWLTVEYFLTEVVFEHPQSLNAVQTETKLKQKTGFINGVSNEWNYGWQKLLNVALPPTCPSKIRWSADSVTIIFVITEGFSVPETMTETCHNVIRIATQGFKTQKDVTVSPSIPITASTTLFPLPTARIPACMTIDGHGVYYPKTDL